MTFSVGAFRTSFPEFADTEVYPDQMINFWADLAKLMVRECVWKNMWVNGVSLYVAHEITIQAQDIKSSRFGGVPGTSGGIANSKSVGQASVSYDSASTSEKDAGWWNRTTYGQQMFRLIRIFGAGAIQL